MICAPAIFPTKAWSIEAAGMLGNDIDLALCGGVESMSRVQIGLKQGMSDWIRRLGTARSFGDRIDKITEFEELAQSREDAPTAIVMLD